jgi:NADH-quinone oxidoreductase subunit N
MKEIIVYLIIALMVLITYNILYEGKDSKELSILTLAMALGLSDNPIEWIIAISGIVTMLLSTGDEETSTLFLLAIMGMLVIVNTNLLILIYLGLELIALTLYVLAARERKSVKSTEAGIKYLILGALSTGILLLGMSLAYATTGTTSLESVSGTAATLIKIGLLFKIGATPFHM